MQDINLLQGYQSERVEFNIKSATKTTAWVVGVLAGLLLVSFSVLYVMSANYARQARQTMAQEAEYRAVTETKTAVSGKSAQIAGLETMLQTAQYTSYIGAQPVSTIVGALGDSAFLDSAILGETGEVKFSGKAAARADVTAFAYRLKKTGLFADVQVKVITAVVQQKESAPLIYDFTIEALRKGGAANE